MTTIPITSRMVLRFSSAIESMRSFDAMLTACRLAVLLAICVILTLCSDSFLHWNNILNVLRQASLIFLIASGLTLVILCGGIDLSVTANLALSASISAMTLKSTGVIALGLMVGPVCGAMIGYCNALLVTRLRLPPFIATYGMLWVLGGLNYYVLGGDAIFGFPSAFRALGIGSWLGIPIPVYLMLATFVAILLFSRSTTIGHEFYSIGANPVAARISGIPVQRRLVLAYVMSGTMAGLAAVIYLARVNSIEADVGDPLLLPTVAAIAMGGTSLFGGVGGIFGTLLGAVILTVVVNGMNLLSVESTWQPFVTGFITLLAVVSDMMIRRSMPTKS